MPNWINNNVEIVAETKERAEEILKSLGSDNREFDFNNIIPMPAHSDSFYAYGPLGSNEEKEYGTNNWYHWSIANWGTKWNAYDIDIQIQDNKIRVNFHTAWDTPYPIFQELAKKFNCKVTVEFYDMDDFGRTCGNIECLPDGKCSIVGHDNDWDWFAGIVGEDYMEECEYIKGVNGWE